ncbi:MAG: hypothetical protein H6696_16905 [Deferribacteres bacterium]|nr:hypothetical protein [candidate division KSB1 bacterium]MCB9503614.1 hypothetical protein [Deferribacteres bacterium]
MKFFCQLLVSFFILILFQIPVLCQDSLSAHLQPFHPFINKSWKAKVAESSDKSPLYDIAKWERVLNGKGIRILHSVNDGDYGGETMIIWDSLKECLVFYYFTTAGFYTNGTVDFEDGKMISHEYVSGNNSISEVKSISDITSESEMTVITHFLKEGKWSEGKRVLYVEDPEAEVIFK